MIQCDVNPVVKVTDLSLLTMTFCNHNNHELYEQTSNHETCEQTDGTGAKNWFWMTSAEDVKTERRIVGVSVLTTTINKII